MTKLSLVGLVLLDIFISFGMWLPANAQANEGRFFKIYKNVYVTTTFTQTSYSTCFETIPGATACSLYNRKKRFYDEILLDRQTNREPWSLKKYLPRFYSNEHTINNATELDSSIQSPFIGQPLTPSVSIPPQDKDKRANGFFVQLINQYTKTVLTVKTVAGPTVRFAAECNAAVRYEPTCPSKSCSTNTDCNFLFPSCVYGQCIRCTADSQCPSSKPFCETTTGVCSECTGGLYCVGLAVQNLIATGKNYCDVYKSGTCSECIAGVAACFNPLPICENNVCRGCNSLAECNRVTDGITPYTSCSGGECL